MTILGLDLDNTIIIYDKLFKELALKENLIPENIEPQKNKIREYLNKNNREDDFTFLQSKVYGENIDSALIAEGFDQFLNSLDKRIKIYIISHKTKYPIKGKKINLQLKAKEWLIKKNIIGNRKRIKEQDVFFEETLDLKIKRIEKINCDIFVDDLPKVLEKLNPAIKKILYDPNNFTNKKFNSINHWRELNIDAI